MTHHVTLCSNCRAKSKEIIAYQEKLAASEAKLAELDAQAAEADRLEHLHVREWKNAILQHEEKRDQEATLREGLERRSEAAESKLAIALEALRDAIGAIEHAEHPVASRWLPLLHAKLAKLEGSAGE